MDQIILGLLVLIVVVILFKYSPSYFTDSSQDNVDLAVKMFKENKPTTDIMAALSAKGMSPVEAFSTLEIAQGKLRMASAPKTA